MYFFYKWCMHNWFFAVCKTFWRLVISQANNNWLWCTEVNQNFQLHIVSYIYIKGGLKVCVDTRQIYILYHLVLIQSKQKTTSRIHEINLQIIVLLVKEGHKRETVSYTGLCLPVDKNYYARDRSMNYQCFVSEWCRRDADPAFLAAWSRFYFSLSLFLIFAISPTTYTYMVAFH